MRNPFSRGRIARPFQPAPEVEVDDELSFHLEQRIRDYIARGMTPDEARAAAHERFGNVSGVRTECAELLEADRRAASRRDWIGDLRQDLRYGARSAIRTPVFSLLAVTTLALGIGANAAVFGVVKSVLLDALPYADADRIMRVYGRFLQGDENRGPLSAGTVTDLAERQRSFESMAAFAGLPRDAVFTGDDGPKVVKLAWAQPALFGTLGVPASRGRVLRDEDAEPDTIRNVVLTHAAWQRLFAGDPQVMEKTILVNGLPRTVVGIMPRGFAGPIGEVDFYFPLGLRASLRDPVGARGSHWLGMVGRLKPGIDPGAAERELVSIAADLAREYPKDNGSVSIAALPVRDAIVGDTRTPLIVLMASAALVLLIACANLAGAMLSRTISRRKEFALRIALGAGQGRIVRQLLTESTLLAVAGGLAGVLLAITGLRVLRGLALPALPPYANLSLDTGALLFTSLVALAAGLAFGMAPALAVGRADPQDTLRDDTRGASESRRSRRLRGVLVAGQIALCVSLLAGAGLLARSLWAMTSAPIGFESDGVLTANLQLPPSRYRTVEAVMNFHSQLEERLGALPGVVAAASTSELPTRVMNRNGVFVEGAPPPPDDAVPFVLYASVSDGYFRTLEIPLLSGRTFGPEDHAEAPPVAVISEAMAKRHWPSGNALGSRLRMGPNPEAPLITVIGIVGDVRNDAAQLEPEPQAYGSFRQQPGLASMYVVRTASEPLSLVRPFERALAEIDPGIPLHQAMPLSEVLSEGLAGRRLPVVLMTAFGALSLLLASVGVYAMFASMAAAREREFGVRIALGSSPGRLAGLVVRQGALWMGLGLAGGAVGVYFVAKLLGTMLYGVTPFDPVTLGVAVLLLLVCASIALLGPVRRASRVDPISVLR